MPIRSSLERDGPEDIARLSAAFESALGKLGLVDRKDPATTAGRFELLDECSKMRRDGSCEDVVLVLQALPDC